ncbi:zinc ribbon domain-containing protein [Gorillibacterium sp. CAU 1737]|uniref:zinc ribbon domain-containing protein n=1 Tax=Gorillibacterium sp. CAU 1737 TaxID=3140362 RepID=UPI003261C274
MKICIACGMPMKSLSDYAMEDEKKDYCRHCSRPDGTMQSYSEKLQSFVKLIIKTQGLDIQVATTSAKAMMMRLPAWEKFRETVDFGN